MSNSKAEFVTRKGRDAKIVDGAEVTLTAKGWDAVNENPAEQYFNAVQGTAVPKDTPRRR
jgi:hypothetical protein